MRLLVEDTSAHRLYRDPQNGDIFAAQPTTQPAAAIGDDPARWLTDAAPRIILRCAGEPAAGDLEEAAAVLLSWSQPGWERFDRQVAAAQAAAKDAGAELLIRPDARGMLADAVCTRSWVRRTASPRCKLLLDPVAWFTPDMLRFAQDHLDRLTEISLELIAEHAVACILLRSLNTADGKLAESPIAAGDLDQSMLLERLRPLAAAAPAAAVLDPNDWNLIDAPPEMKSGD